MIAKLGRKRSLHLRKASVAVDLKKENNGTKKGCKSRIDSTDKARVNIKL